MKAAAVCVVETTPVEVAVVPLFVTVRLDPVVAAPEVTARAVPAPAYVFETVSAVVESAVDVKVGEPEFVRTVTVLLML